jgi:hypothetical protein
MDAPLNPASRGAAPAQVTAREIRVRFALAPALLRVA